MVTPIIDVLDDENFNVCRTHKLSKFIILLKMMILNFIGGFFKYYASPMVRGAFDWNLVFRWVDTPHDPARKRPSDPVKSPGISTAIG